MLNLGKIYMEEYLREYKLDLRRRTKEITVTQRTLDNNTRDLERLQALPDKENDPDIMRMIEVFQWRVNMAADELTGFQKRKQDLEDKHEHTLQRLQELTDKYGDDVAKMYLREKNIL